jgi:hypothetical protein
MARTSGARQDEGRTSSSRAVVEKKVFFDWFASVKIGQIKDAPHATIRLKHGSQRDGSPRGRHRRLS